MFNTTHCAHCADQHEGNALQLLWNAYYYIIYSRNSYEYDTLYRIKYAMQDILNQMLADAEFKYADYKEESLNKTP